MIAMSFDAIRFEIGAKLCETLSDDIDIKRLTPDIDDDAVWPIFNQAVTMYRVSICSWTWLG